MTELLVVSGIILVVMALLLPALGYAITAAKRARISSELSSIATALEQYHSDSQGNYPRIFTANTGAAVLGKALFALGPTSDPVPMYSATDTYAVGQVVNSGGIDYECIAANTAMAPPNAVYWKLTTIQAAPVFNAATLYTPGMMVNDGTSPGVLYVCIANVTGTAPPADTMGSFWAPFSWGDGAGPGQYRLRAGAAIHEAYLRADKFNVRGTDILDTNDNPILYFPASPASHQLGIGTGYIGAGPATSTFTLTDNVVPFRASGETDDTHSTRRFCAMLGDADPNNASNATNCNGRIDANTPETAKAAGVPFILWSAGPDGVFGPPASASSDTDTRNVDDVTNFR